jgi:hypothetical protein
MGKLGVTQKATKHIITVLLLFGISLLPPARHSLEGSQASGERKIDYASIQQGILKFEAIVDNVINSTFRSTPFALVQKTKGAYLEGYGLSFAFLVNIHRAMLNTPFGQIKRAAATSPELKKQRIDELRENLIQTIQENGESFRQLGKEDCVTIIAFVEDRNIPDEPSASKTIILTILKRDMDELGHQQERFQDFKKRIKIVEY